MEPQVLTILFYDREQGWIEDTLDVSTANTAPAKPNQSQTSEIAKES